MVYKDSIIKVLNYVDNNIKEPININLLADISAYSIPQFFRMFISYMDMTPMNYVLRRKLYFAAKELINNDNKIIDIAYSYGFDSHDVFSRAFKRYYGISPITFRKNGNKLNDFYRENSYCISGFAIPVSLNNQVKDDNSMQEQIRYDVKIVTLAETKLIGIERKIAGDEWAFDVFYNSYDRIFRNAPNRLYPLSTNATHALSEMQPDGSYMYYIGIEVNSLEDIPEGAIGKVIPSQMCAMIEYEGDLDYREVTDYLYRVWFEENIYKTGHLASYPYCTIEYYAPNRDCDVYNERIYIPIQDMKYCTKKLSSYSGVYYRAVNESGSKAKDESFSVMLKWADANHLFDRGEVKFEVYYGNTEDEKVFCEVFYRTEDTMQYIENSKLQTKIYPEATYFHSSSIHHFLEPNSRAIWRFIESNDNLSLSNAGEPDIRPYFEEYKLSNNTLDMYTQTISIYVFRRRTMSSYEIQYIMLAENDNTIHTYPNSTGTTMKEIYWYSNLSLFSCIAMIIGQDINRL